MIFCIKLKPYNPNNQFFFSELGNRRVLPNAIAKRMYRTVQTIGKTILGGVNDGRIQLYQEV
jgi:hypothetical protein